MVTALPPWQMVRILGLSVSPGSQENTVNGSASGSLVGRAMGAALLNVDTYEAVEADRSATAQAGIVVGIVAIASAIGASGSGAGGMVGAIVSAFVGWLIWAGVTNLVGTKRFGGTADWGELLRTLGFAQAPGVLLVLGVIPILGFLVNVVVGIWVLIAGIVAIRQALDFGTGKAILTAVVSLILVVIARVVIETIFGVGALI